ncbi:hypothetical protein [Thermomonospora umbrina]|uniref:Lipoprotein n=1 Tax=Thermomonospora umbrina TaxID=111806 RepID=A0A3D9SKH6_9ACTN|nr:hypothetical protein [Thermomonospora umbrina]REE96207.1 hypothetical protein DFJ69_1634 [Thermomonospora umbrina]
MRGRWKVAAAVTALALGTAACGGGADGGDAKDANNAPGALGREEAAGGVGTVDTSRVIASQTFDSPIAAGAELEVGIAALRVSGRLAHLTVVLTPRVPGQEQMSVYGLNGGSAPDVALLDTVNLKRHRVVKAGGKELQPDAIFVKLRNGQPNVQTYTFAAPPEGVDAVDVSFGQWAPFRDVPVTR